MSFKSKTILSRKSKIVNAVAVTGLAALMAVAPAALAEDLSVAKKIEVRVKVADLQSPTGVKKVYSDLQRKARQACTPDSMTISPRAQKRCAADLVDQFVEDLDSEEVTKLHNARET